MTQDKKEFPICFRHLILNVDTPKYLMIATDPVLLDDNDMKNLIVLSISR